MSETSQLIIPDLVKEGLCNLLANTTNRHAKLLSLHDAKLFSDPFYERIRTLQSENEALREAALAAAEYLEIYGYSTGGKLAANLRAALEETK